MIGTSSVRRQAQLLHARPDLAIGPMRGNVQTRLEKVASGDLRGVSCWRWPACGGWGWPATRRVVLDADSHGARGLPGHRRHHRAGG